MTKVGGLGRGLGSLIPNKKITEEVVSQQHRDLLIDESDKILQVPLDKIDVNPMQPRRVFDHSELEELINSIKEYGVIQPLIVTKQGDRYELIAGERRMRSSKIAGLSTVPCIVREADEQEKLELALIENVQRQQLNPIEEALAYQKLMDEFNLTQEEVAERVGKSRSSIANRLRVINLPEEVQKALVDGKITEGHARVIAGFETDEKQLNFLEQILNYNFTVRDAEQESRKLTKRGKSKSREQLDPTTEAAKEEIRDALSTKVSVTKKGGRGQIVIDFYSEEEFNDIVFKITN
ncbi:chromosome partitioning protein ParB [Candidatus Falkowbacteria bacterium CG10_big_fil_rev_8_21_14_0_10_39_11]|uniref:Chromosome partitioning protein ParB n=1 Tax=Candidatus Falkowbacteria bacterium CG10_big_fil_rev_8_21_14_0_10_39_11 TaxID=1974565 RepID=A0A2H0V597_9BACT|nr:MAG: chromosome partitioning protein ParB [Candidatus Falkowbacteria bacterium CG10_big_fil_rev_8_21_14_0_10_39_11]